MTGDDRLARLEARVASLESLVRRLLRAREEPEISAAPAPEPEVSTAPAPVRPSPRLAPLIRRPAFDSEVWLGERGLLAMGVVALILAAGYLLKLSFDRGWVSPLLRCIGGAAAGAVVGAVGWRLESRYRTYGAALVGCGAAIIYLAVWAAVRQYQFLPPTQGIIALALVSLALAAIAYGLDVEALGATAAVGAFFAPIFLSPGRGDANILLLYLAVMAGALGVVAARRRWRLAALIIAASYFGLGWTAGTSLAGSATPAFLLAYGVAGGTAGLFLGLRERWWETRALSFWGGWALVASAAEATTGPPLLAAAIVLAMPLWWWGVCTPEIWPQRTERGYRGAEWSLGEALYFFVTPLFLAWAVRLQNPTAFDASPGLAAAIVGVAYTAAGYVRTRPAFALIGAAALAVGAWLEWTGLPAVWALLGLGIMFAGLDHLLRRTDGRWYGIAALLVAMVHILGIDTLRRSGSDPAFVGGWAVALWAVTGLAAVFALGYLRRGESANVPARTLLWVVAGALLLFGVTGEIRRYSAQHSVGHLAADLAGGVLVSIWWLLFAAALVLIGFRRGAPVVRRFGLGVAALAGAKVLLFDLRSLDAMYRVGSVFVLGLVSLLVAYLYHRHARIGNA